MQKFFQAAAFLGAAFLIFVWGVAATTWNIFPHRQIMHVQAGIDAWGKIEDTKMPGHVIPPETTAQGPDPVTSYSDISQGDLILMTGGFFFRQDLCPKFGCMAYVMDRTGKVLHTWEADPAALFTPADFKGFTGYPDPRNLDLQGVDIDSDGNLVVTFQGRNVFPYQVGIGKFDWNGKLLWMRVDNSHHWPKVGADNRIYVPIARITKDETTVAGTVEPLKCKNGAVFQEGVQILSPEGTVVKQFWMDDVVRKSDVQGLAYSVRNDCDPYHVNAVDLLNAAAVARLPGTKVGDLALSLRASSAVVVLDPDSGIVRRIIKGPMVAQHSVRVLPDGQFAVFDNLGGIDTAKGTRVLALDPATSAGHTIFPRDKNAPGGDLYSDAQGEINFSSDGSRVLVAETLGGRVFEVDVATGKALWQFDSISDMAPYLGMIGEGDGKPHFYRIQTQGARYVSRADFDRMSAQN